MDAFRRFRSRRKSRGQADVFTSFGDAESNYRPGSSPWQNPSLKSPVTATRPSDIGPDRKVSHEQFRQPTSPASQRSQGTTGRTQPLLMGLSKPFADSRPGTADSMQRALDRAADSVKLNRSLSPRSHTAQKQARYIDIFAISEQTAHSTKAYNEDIASRNLDTVALTIEGQHYRYEPASKYQEEVAARNAHPSPPTYVPLMRRPSTVDRKQSLDGRPSSSHSDAYSHRPLGNDTGRSRRTLDSSTHRPLQSNPHIRDQRDQLPVIPQERSSEDFGTDKNESESLARKDQELERAHLRWLEAHRLRLTDYRPNTEKPLPASPRPPESLRDSGISSTTDITKRTSGISDQSGVRLARGASTTGSHPNHRKPGVLEPSVYLVATPPKQGTPAFQDFRADRVSDGSRHYERLRPQSNTSSASAYKRVLVGNRTIMDLTGEEDPDVASVVSYMPTPVIENARLDAIEKVVPTMVDHSPPPRLEEKERDQAVPNSRWSSAGEPVLDLDQLARRSQAISETARALNAARLAALAPALPELPKPSLTPAFTFSPIKTWTSAPPSKVITFSPINTLTSTSPRNSQELTNSRRQAQSNNEPSKNQAQSLTAPSKANPRLSANIAPVVKIFAEVKPDAASISPVPEIKRSEANRPALDRKTSSEHSISSKKRGKMRERFEEKESIRKAAKSIIPAGPIDQEPLPGVKTRDFAAMPIEKPTNKRVEVLSERKKTSTNPRSSKDLASSEKLLPSEKKNRLKPSRSASKVAMTDTSSSMLAPVQPAEKKEDKKSSKKSSKSGSATARKSRPKSVFDEAAFQKKHAEANAALLRLQQSLQDPLEDTMSQSDTPRDTLTPADRSFSPVESRATPQPSPSAAAIAMIAAATSSPRSTPRPILPTQTSSSTIQRPRETQAKFVPSNSELGNDKELKTTTLDVPTSASYPPIAYNPTLGRLESSSKPPPSPGEVSLSAFPIPTPTPRATSPASGRGPPAYVKDVGGPVRRSSQSSRVSASAFSIPFTMVPNRTGSLLENRTGTLIPSTTSHIQMNSIDAFTKASGMASP